MTHNTGQLRILITAPRYHNNLCDTIRAFREHGHPVTLAVLHRFQTEDEEYVTPIVLGFGVMSRILLWVQHTLRGYDGGNTFRHRFGVPPLWSFFRLIREERPEVLIVRDITNGYSLLALLAARIIGAHVIVLLQVNDVTIQRKRRSIRLAHRFFRASIVTPLMLSKETKVQFPEVQIIPFAFSYPQGSAIPGFHLPLRILAVGKFIESKGHHILIRAVCALEETHKQNLSLTCIGIAPDIAYQAELARIAIAGGIGDRVTFLSNVPWHEMEREYRAHDVFVLPTICEPASAAVPEAMSYGLPVISSRGNGTHCYIEDGVTGITVPPGDSAALEAALTAILSDRAGLAHMGAAARSTARERHDMESVYQQFSELIMKSSI